ncbi:Uncharacterised protein [uncultured archaeon]|nr:Uncharacterised protein [uncultured archaeon]
MIPMANIGLGVADGFRFQLGAELADAALGLVVLLFLIIGAVVVALICMPTETKSSPREEKPLNGTWDVLFRTGNDRKK